jgi:hypothetical protein
MALAARPTARVGVRSSSSSGQRAVVARAATMQRVGGARGSPRARRDAAGGRARAWAPGRWGPICTHPPPPPSPQSIGAENYVEEVPVTLTRPDLDTPDT